MSSKSKFILRQVFFSFLPLLLAAIILLPLDYYWSTPEDPFRWHTSIPWIWVIFPIVELFQLFTSYSKIKKMGIDLNKPENQKGVLNYSFQINLGLEDITQTLRQNVWKFKIESQKETEDGTLLTMKYYQLTFQEKVEILVKETGANQCNIRITAGVRKAPIKWMLSSTFWAQSIKHIQYFENVLSEKEEFKNSFGALAA